MPQCVACDKSDPDKRAFHQFTDKEHLRPLWLKALTENDAAKARLDVFLRSTGVKQYICDNHFSDDSYNISPPNFRILKRDAVPMNMRTLPSNDLTALHSPPRSPFAVPSPISRPVADCPLPIFRLAEARVPPCCRCCCRKETIQEMKEDPTWEPPTPCTPPTPPTPTVVNCPSSKYSIVSTASLVQLLSRCNSCPSGQCNLSFMEEAHALSCKCTCTSCGEVFMWSNSPVLPTANASAREKLKEINVDIVVGSAVTAVGPAKLNNFLNTVGLNCVSKRSYHRLKNDYLIPGITQVFGRVQEELFAKIRDRLSKGGKLHVAGDGSFDSRGYSAMWCKYYLVDAETGEALIFILMNKHETGSSGKLEVECLERALNMLADKIGGVHNIATLVTDRHSSVIKMMKEKFPSIRHQFDPWHYFRNFATNLYKINNRDYMALVKHWSRTLINKAYDAVVRAQGNGILASEMLRSSLLCITGQHDFSHDSSFTQFKKCLHSPPPPNHPYIAKGGRAYKRLETMLYTDRNIADIQSVSWMLKTSTCESLNALAWRYSPKDDYFTRSGHEMRTMMAFLHWNELKQGEMNGTRLVIGQKSYFNKTLKKHVARNVKTPAPNAWRASVKEACYEVRAALQATPYANRKRENQKKKEEWSRVNTPTVPHKGDANLDASDEEDEADPPLLKDTDRMLLLVGQIEEELEEDVDNMAQEREENREYEDDE